MAANGFPKAAEIGVLGTVWSFRLPFLDSYKIGFLWDTSHGFKNQNSLKCQSIQISSK